MRRMLDRMLAYLYGTTKRETVRRVEATEERRRKREEERRQHLARLQAEYDLIARNTGRRR